MQGFIKLGIMLMLKFWKQTIIPYLSHISIALVFAVTYSYSKDCILRLIHFKERNAHTTTVFQIKNDATSW